MPDDLNPHQLALLMADAFRLNSYRATVISHDTRKGYAKVKVQVGENIAMQRSVRCGYISTQMQPGTSVIVGYDRDRELAIIAIDFTRQIASGLNPAANNAADRYIYGSTLQDSLQTLQCHPLANDSMIVVARPWFYLKDGVWYESYEQQVDLTGYIPSSGNHVMVGIWIADDNTVEVTTSTEQSLLDPLDLTDAQECYDAASERVSPVRFWRLYSSMTGIKEADVWRDSRQVLNVDHSLTVQEESEGVIVQHVRKLIFTDGALLDLGSGEVFVDPVDSGSGGYGGYDAYAIHTNYPYEIHGITEKTTPVAADEVVIEDSEDTYNKKRVQLGNLAAAIGAVTDVTASSPLASSGGTTPDISLGDITTKIIFDEWAESGTPSADTIWVYAADDNGFSVWRLIDSTGKILQVVRDQVMVAKNTTGSSISAGSAVKLNTVASGVSLMVKSIATNDPVSLADGVVMDTTADSAFGRVMLRGIMPLDTSGYSAGALLYLSAATDGLLTATSPASGAGWLQIVAQALDSSASGHLLVNPRTRLDHLYTANLNIGTKTTVNLNFFPDASHVITLKAPAVAANRAIFLPDANGTLLVDPLTTKGDIIAYSTLSTRLGVGANGTHLVADSAQATGLRWQSAYPFAIIEEQQSSGTAAGSSTATTWTTRVLNTEVVDADNIVTISSNKFKPIAGVYKVEAWSPHLGNATNNGAARIRLYNSTAAAEVFRSTNYALFANTGILVPLVYYITANGTDEYTIDYYVSQARTTNGLGNPLTEGSEVERYTRVLLTKIG